MATCWFYRVMGEEIGPCSAAELKEQAALGRIQQDSLVRKGSEGEWVLARRVKGLFDVASVKSRPTPEPPPAFSPETVSPPAAPPPLPPAITTAATAQPTTTMQPARKPGKKGATRYWLMSVILIMACSGGYATLRGSKASINPLQSLANSKLQSKLDLVIEADHRNAGIEVSAYYRDMLDHSVVVFDLQTISEGNSRLDVFRVLLDFAEAVKEEPPGTVELAFRGKTKFRLEGYYFQILGKERNIQNPAYTIRTFPENLKTISGLRAYPEWTGGILGVLNRQMEDFEDFHNQWYIHDLKAINLRTLN